VALRPQLDIACGTLPIKDDVDKYASFNQFVSDESYFFGLLFSSSSR
jgi:hypothetical protein